jgi:anti-sigma B factor antagonist
MDNIDFELRDSVLVGVPRMRRIDAGVAMAFRQAVVQAAGSATVVVLDLSSVDGMDSTGLGSLVGILKALPAGAAVRLVAVHPTVRKLLELTRLARIFVEYPGVDLAIAA